MYRVDGKNIPIPRITSTYFKNLSVKSAKDTFGLSYLAKFIVFFLTYALYFSDIMQSILLDILPEFFFKYLNAPAYLIALTVGLFYIIENLVPMAIQLLHDAIMLDFNNPVVTFMYIYVVSMFIFDCFDVIDFAALKYSGRNLVNMFTYPIATIVLSFIQFVIAIVISIPVGTIICLIIFMFYATSIFIYPFYSMFFVKDDNAKEKGINLFFRAIAGFIFLPNTFEDINKYLQKSFKTNTGIPEEEKTLLDKFMIVMNMIFVSIYSNIYYIMNIILLSFSIADYSKNIQTSALRGNLIAMDSITIAIFLVLIFSNTAANINNFGKQEGYTKEELTTNENNDDELEELRGLAQNYGFTIPKKGKLKLFSAIKGINKLNLANAGKVSTIASAYGLNVANATKLNDLAKEKGFDMAHASKLKDLARENGLDVAGVSKLAHLAKEKGMDFTNVDKLADLAKENGIDHDQISKLAGLAATNGFDLANAANMVELAKQNGLDLDDAVKLSDLVKADGLDLADASNFINHAKAGAFGDMIAVKKSTDKDIASDITSAISNAIDNAKKDKATPKPTNSIEKGLTSLGASISEAANSLSTSTSEAINTVAEDTTTTLPVGSTVPTNSSAFGYIIKHPVTILVNLPPNIIGFIVFFISWILLLFDYFFYIGSMLSYILSFLSYIFPICLHLFFNIILPIIATFVTGDLSAFNVNDASNSGFFSRFALNPSSIYTRNYDKSFSIFSQLFSFRYINYVLNVKTFLFDTLPTFVFMSIYFLILGLVYLCLAAVGLAGLFIPVFGWSVSFFAVMMIAKLSGKEIRFH